MKRVLPLFQGVGLGLILFLAPSMSAADSVLKTLPGHVPKEARRLRAKGHPPVTNELRLVIGLPLHDTNGLETFLAQVSDPQSPNYRHYLTPVQFTQRFGPTESDYEAVRAFALKNNLKIISAHSNRLVLDVSGSVTDVEKAFHVTMQTYAHPTEARDFFAPEVEPSVEVALPISDISGLNNYILPHPKNLRANAAPTGNATPRNGSASDGGYLGNDFRAAYYPGGALTGAGQMIGLLEFDGFYASDITKYEAAAGYAAVPLETILLDNYNGTPTTGPDSGNGEVSLDIEVALAMAPGLSKIVLFEAGPYGFQNDILNAMASNFQIKQFSCSWGWGGGPSITTDNIFMEMAAQGQSFFNASGDSDAFTVGAASVNGVDNSANANAPSSSPYITMVGGTTLSTTGPGGAWSAETVWNWGLDSGSYVGSSGGVSSSYVIPAWQTGINMTTNGGSTFFRNIPDVALTADNVYVTSGNGGSGIFGGTSCAAPLWAAVTALINQQATANGRTPVGFINPAIYALAQTSKYSSTFHDIVTGNNTSSDSPASYYAVPGYDLCTGLGTPMTENLINALAGPPDALGIVPLTGFTFAGPFGGPFYVSSETLILTNSSAESIDWSASDSAAWLNITPASGTLSAGSVATVTISLADSAGNLTPGIYTNTVVFSDLTTQVGQSRAFILQIGQSIVQNGGFETGNFTGWTVVGHTVVRSGHNSTVYNAVEAGTSSYKVAHSGAYGAFLGDDQPATISQTLATTPGQNYLISLWLNNPQAGSIQAFQVNWSGLQLYGITNPPVLAWTNLQFVATAISTNTVLQFGVENQPNYFGLDDVSVTPLPAMTFHAAVSAAGSFNLTWNTASGLNYQVQYKNNLADPVWINLGSPTKSTGNSLTVADTNAVGSSAQRFYRLAIVP